MASPSGQDVSVSGIPIDEAALGSAGGDSAFEDQSTKRNLKSWSNKIYEYRKLHGRTFQVSNPTEYYAPHDDQQDKALDINHHMISLILGGKLFLAPLDKDPGKVLDIGTGTGIWAIDMAEQFHNSTVIGTDISSISSNRVPANCEFQVEDAQLDWPRPENDFDFIHVRHMEGCIDSWPALYQRAFKHLKPGGWFEHTGFDIQTRSESPLVGPDHIYHKWAGFFFEAGDRIGKTFKYPQNDGMKKDMEAAGFVDIVQKKWSIPIGEWSSDPLLKEVGMYSGLFVKQSLEGWAGFLFKEVLQWENDDIETCIDNMRRELNNLETTPYFDMYVCYGRKPEKSPPAAAEAS